MKKFKSLLAIGASIILFALGAVVMLSLVKGKIASNPEPAFHEHANFALFINGEKFNFSTPEYSSVQPCKITKLKGNIAQAHGLNLDESVHLHDQNGGVVHVHTPGVTWHDYFESVEIEFEDGKLVLDENNEYISDDDSFFYYFINGEQVDHLANREIRDLDQVLISYSDEPLTKEQLTAQLVQINDDACLYSESCSHRGTIPPESCGGNIEKSGLLKWLGV